MTPRVLVLAPPMASAGGIQRYTATLVRALEDELGPANLRCISVEPASGHRPRLGRLSKLSFGWRALLAVARWRPQLIVCTHLALGPVARMLSGPRRPYWIVLHGIEAWAKLPAPKQRALDAADRLIVTSAFNREQVMRRHGIAAARISSLPCVLDDSLLKIAPAGLSALPANVPVVLTVARMDASERYKGHDVALRALPLVLHKLPDVLYAIVGDGDDRPRLEQRARDLGIAKHVWFAGALTDSELSAVYRRSHVFLLPAQTVLDDHAPKGEGFGIVFLEAMGFGKPVIGPNYGAPAELIRSGENGLVVDPDDEASVADALLALFSDPARAEAMGSAGREWVSVRYSYNSFREHLREVLHSHLGQRETRDASYQGTTSVVPSRPPS
jgi:glycosyltransferase involved in cell wall biosynthesis